MMIGGVNFLHERVRLQEELSSRDKKLAFVTAIALGVFLTIVFSVLGYTLFLQKQQRDLEGAILERKNTLVALSKVEKSFLERGTALMTISNIMKQRGKHWDAIAYIYGLLPIGSRISGVNVSKTEGTVECTINADNVFVYTQVIEKLQSEQVKQNGYSLKLGNLVRSKTGSYDLGVSLIFEDLVPKNPAVAQPVEEI